jgi:hypothetical protein
MPILIPTFSGKDAVIRFFFNGSEVPVLAKTWEIGPNVTDVADGVNGEQRDRLQTIVNYFEGTMTVYQNDVSALLQLLSNINNDDLEVLPLDKTFGFNFKILDGTRQNFVGKEGVIGAFRVNQGGRTERVMLSIPFRCRYFSQVASA